MLLDYEVLKLIWWALVGVLLIGFAITDGMDMGVGNLLPFVGKKDEERRVIINVVGPHWDGNQVWFITAGCCLPWFSVRSGLITALNCKILLGGRLGTGACLSGALFLLLSSGWPLETCCKACRSIWMPFCGHITRALC